MIKGPVQRMIRPGFLVFSEMKPDRHRHGKDRKRRDLPKIATLLQTRPAKWLDDVQAHQGHKQHRQDFEHKTPLTHPFGPAISILQASSIYAVFVIHLFILSFMDEALILGVDLTPEEMKSAWRRPG
ncbi:hypothetical protein [Brucella pseudogrignonensis]|uniref:hypothetical protein n=1 Tax=Brucella pseudogrignonensis TaxID=419475 RepID=UPI001431CB2C|nr:hypothetical protein [Brucella pseudogrignonensis]